MRFWFQASPHLDRALHPHLCTWLRDAAGRNASGHGLQHQERYCGQYFGFLMFWSHTS
ncbi:hypothetical protein AAY473_002449 [Plecturocebus cupreus]